VTTAGPYLEKPSWADTVSSGKDVYLTLEGDVRGMYLHEDPRGWGAYATLYVASGSLSEIEAALGSASPVPRNPGDFHSGPTVALYVPRGSSTVRIFVELAAQGATDVRSVKVHFQR
jgi:hypothetical protein